MDRILHTIYRGFLIIRGHLRIENNNVFWCITEEYGIKLGYEDDVEKFIISYVIKGR